jgi:hypothetical protein
MALPAPVDNDQLEGLHREAVERLVHFLADRIPTVREANQRLEDETDRQNEAGAEKLAATLGELGALCATAPSSSDEQLAEFDRLEGTLRRRMTETWEGLLELRMGEVDELWERYELRARPLQARDELSGCPSKHEIDRLRHKCQAHFQTGSCAKRESSWERWEAGTDAFIAAAETATTLLEGLGKTMSAANRHRDDLRRDRGARRLSILAIAISLVVGVGGVVTGWLLRKDAKQPPDVTIQAPPFFPPPARPETADPRFTPETGSRRDSGGKRALPGAARR